MSVWFSILAVAIVIPLIVLMYRARPEVSFVVFSAFYLWPLLALPGAGFDTRSMAAVIVLSQVPRLKKFDLRTMGAPVYVLAIVLIASLLSVSWSVSAGRTVSSSIGIALAIVGVAVYGKLLSSGALSRLTLGLLLAATLASTLYGLVFPSAAFEGGRLRGIMENANGLGTVAAFAAILSAAKMQRPLLPVAFCITVIAFSGSRGAMLAALIGLVAQLVLSESQRLSKGVRAAAVAYTVSVAGLILLVVRPDIPLFRTTDSRTEIWQDLVPLITAYWPLGVGAGAHGDYSTNSFLKVLVELGVAGGLLYIAYISAALTSVVKNRLVIAVWVTGVVATFFESWLLVGGSYYSFMLLLLCSPGRGADSGSLLPQQVDGGVR